MSYLISNIPFFKCWVRKEFTHNHEQYRGEFIHAHAFAVTTMPDRTLGFQVVFTGCEVDGTDEPNIHGGAMWARMPLTALVADIPLDTMPDIMHPRFAQPWDCSSHHHSVVKLDYVSVSPWICKIDNKLHIGKYLFTIDYSESDLSDDPAQHKQSHVIQLIKADNWTGNIVALPNNRVRVTSPALWETGEGAPDFKPSQWTHNAEEHEQYMNPDVTFNNLYKETKE
jgi:hypothetical protein